MQQDKNEVFFVTLHMPYEGQNPLLQKRPKYITELPTNFMSSDHPQRV